MARAYEFAGRKIIKPGAYTQRYFPEDEGAGSITGRVLILGEAAKGGIPYNAYPEMDDIINVVSGQAEALEWFGGGDIYYGAEFNLTPSSDERFKKPSQARCIVVNQMTQAETILFAGSDEIIDLSFKKFGTDGNTMAVKVSTGTDEGQLLQLKYKGTEILKQDNVTLPLMSILYTGAAATATMTITATKLTTACAALPADDLDITLADFTDMRGLIKFIDDHPSYTCLLTGQGDEFSNVFDAVTAQDIKSATYEAVGNVEAVMRVLSATELFTVALHTGAVRTPITNLSNYQYFTGGSVSTATTADWIAALEKLENYEVNNIVAMTGSIPIQNLVASHVDRMNDVEIKKYRQAGFGAGVTTSTKAQRIAQMKAIDSPYIEYCVSKFTRYDYVNKVNKEFEPYFLYPMIAGLRYAGSVGMDVVFKYVNVLKTPEMELTDQKDYLFSGGTIIEKIEDATSNLKFQIAGNNTTYQGSQVTRTNPSVVYEINVLTKDFEEWLTEQIRVLDVVANSIVIAKIQSAVVTERFPYYRDSVGWITDGPDGQKAFDNVTFTQIGEQIRITATLTMSVTPRFAFNFMTYIVPGQKV